MTDEDFYQHYQLCSSCKTSFERCDPRILPCLHSVCLTCLEKLSQQETPVCPCCSENLEWTATLAEHLPTDHHRRSIIEYINIRNDKLDDLLCKKCGENKASFRCKECIELLCKNCTKEHCRFIKDHSVISFNEVKNKAFRELISPLICEIHKSPLHKYCYSEQKAICNICELTDHRRDESHIVENTSTVYVDKKQELELNIASCKENLETVTYQKANVANEIANLNETKITLANEIDASINNLIEVLEKRRKELKHDLNSAIENRSGNLDAKLKALTDVENKQKEALVFAEKSLEYFGDEDFCHAENIISDRLHNLASKGRNTYVKSSELKHITFARGDVGMLNQLIMANSWLSLVEFKLYVADEIRQLTSEEKEVIIGQLKLYATSGQEFSTTRCPLHIIVKQRCGKEIGCNTVFDESEKCFKITSELLPTGDYTLEVLLKNKCLHQQAFKFIAEFKGDRTVIDNTPYGTKKRSYLHCNEHKSDRATFMCQKCYEFLCEKCSRNHLDDRHPPLVCAPQLEALKETPISKLYTFYSCGKLGHEQRMLELFCVTCDELICHECNFYTHRDHKVDKIQVIYDARYAEIQGILEQAVKTKAKANSIASEIRDELEVLRKSQDQELSMIKKVFNNCKTTLEARKKSVETELAETASKKRDKMQTQLTEMEEVARAITVSNNRALDLIEFSSDVLFLRLYKTLKRRLKNALDSCKQTHVCENGLLKYLDDNLSNRIANVTKQPGRLWSCNICLHQTKHWISPAVAKQEVVVLKLQFLDYEDKTISPKNLKDFLKIDVIDAKNERCAAALGELAYGDEILSVNATFVKAGSYKIMVYVLETLARKDGYEIKVQAQKVEQKLKENNKEKDKQDVKTDSTKVSKISKGQQQGKVMEDEIPVELRNLLSGTCHDTGIETANTKMLGESDKDSLSETYQVHNIAVQHQLEGCSDTQQDHDELSEMFPKKGIYPDLDLCMENMSYQNNPDLNENFIESSKMGCASSKEGSEELENELPYSKPKSDASCTDSSQNASDENKLFGNQKVSAVCRHKEPVGLNSPIVSTMVSSFSPRQSANSDPDELSDSYRKETEGTITADKVDGNTCRSSSEKHFSEKAIRLEDTCSYSNEVDEHIKGIKSHSKKEKKGRHSHDNTADKETDKTEYRPFRGIDQGWKTNDDDYWEEAHEKYEYFWKADTVYSQWYYSVFYDDDKFSCAEQYKQYQKAMLFGDSKIMNEIMNTDSPRKMKSLGSKVSGFSDEVWNANCLDIVKQANILKILVEASPDDAIWGIGCTEDDPDAWDESTWRGTNYLGYVITEVRDELLADEGILKHEEKQVYLPGLKEKRQRSSRRVNNPEGGAAVNE